MEDADLLETKLYETRRRTTCLEQASHRLIQMIEDKIDRRDMPFSMKVQIEEIERLCR